MIKTNLLFEGRREDIENRIKKILNAHHFRAEKIGVPYIIGDLLAKNIKAIFGDLIDEYSPSFARRAMADLAFTDKDGFYYVVDVKTHRLDTKFNMPNLTSVERLSRFYEEDVNYFVLLKVDYQVEGIRVAIKHVTFAPIEFFGLDVGIMRYSPRILSERDRKNWRTN